MDEKTKAYIHSLVPCPTKKKRWRQYSESGKRIFAMNPCENMNEVAKALAERLGL